MERLGIEFISVLGLPPVEFVHLAADLGCSNIGLAAAPFLANPHGYPDWSLLVDKDLRRRTGEALRECGVSISLGEGFLVKPGEDVRTQAAAVDVLAELIAQRIVA